MQGKMGTRICLKISFSTGKMGKEAVGLGRNGKIIFIVVVENGILN